MGKRLIEVFSGCFGSCSRVAGRPEFPAFISISHEPEEVENKHLLLGPTMWVCDEHVWLSLMIQELIAKRADVVIEAARPAVAPYLQTRLKHHHHAHSLRG